MVKQNVVLIVDKREKEPFRSSVVGTVTAAGFEVIEENRGVGDFWICTYTENDATGERDYVPQFFIERKTWDDYINSLESNRIYDQRGRLLETGVRSAFLVEGVRSDFVGYKQRKRIQVEKFLLHSQVRDGISVLYTDDQYETAEQLVHWLGKIQDPAFLTAKNGGKTFAECQRLERKSGMTFDSCYQAQLMQYPGVSSSAVAQCITGLYPNMYALCRAVRNNPADVQQQISEIKVTSKRFGPVKSTRLVEYVSGKEIDWKSLNIQQKKEKRAKRQLESFQTKKRALKKGKVATASLAHFNDSDLSSATVVTPPKRKKKKKSSSSGSSSNSAGVGKKRSRPHGDNIEHVDLTYQSPKRRKKA